MGPLMVDNSTIRGLLVDLDDELNFQLARTTNLVSRTLKRQRKELVLKS